MNQFLSNDRTIEGWKSSYARTAEPSVVDFRALMTEFVPERHTHMLHPYPAKLLPQIPAFFLTTSKIGPDAPPMVLADPFCGTGTVLLEGAIRGLEVIGADTNPLARLIARVKINPVSVRSIHEHLVTISRRVAKMGKCDLPPVVNISEWYSIPIASELGKLRVSISEIRSQPIREFMLVCFSACARRMSCADPRLSVPVKINPDRKKKYGQHFAQLKRHLDHLKPENVLGTFKSIVERNAAGVESLKSVIKKKPLFSIFDDARLLHNNVGAKSVDLIITSPPYVGAQKYIRSSSLSLGWLDLAYNGHLRPLERLTIGREHFGRDEIEDETITGVKDADKLLRQVRKNNPLRAHIASTYLVEIHSSLLAMHRILKCGGQLIMITGPNTICGNNFDTPTFVEELAHRAGFVTQFKLMDHIRSRGLMTKRNKTAGMITSEVVLGLAKP